MPANIRILCRAVDCQWLNGIICGNSEIEVSPSEHCLVYKPVEIERIEEEDDFDEEDDEEDTEWLNEEEEDENDLDAYGPDDE
jgi:hypothetical protein